MNRTIVQSESQKRKTFWGQRLLQNHMNRRRLLAIAASYHAIQYCLKTPRQSSLYHGGDRIHEMLHFNHPARVLHALRMAKSTFLLLTAFCDEHTALRSGRASAAGKGVSIEEKLAIFLYITSNGVSNRAAQELFQRSGNTISRSFHQVLNALLLLHKHVVKLPDATQPLHPRIASDKKYFPYFKDCIGALDGTHIKAFIQSAAQAPYRNRKGELTQNVLGVCTFDLQFSFIYAGWEGSAHDTRVVEDAISRGGFSIPSGKYYLADAGYPNKPPFLVPYRGTRYHLREQALANQRPSNYKELFNLRHSSLRNAIERIFGVLKRRFQCLGGRPQEYSFPIQVKLIYALTALHNFIRIHEVFDSFEEEEEANAQAQPADSGAQYQDDDGDAYHEDDPENEAFRESMAKRMWENYEQVLAQRRAC